MKKILFFTAIVLFLLTVNAQGQGIPGAAWKNTLIPKPASLIKGEGYFSFPKDIIIIIPANEEIKKLLPISLNGC